MVVLNFLFPPISSAVGSSLSSSSDLQLSTSSSPSEGIREIMATATATATRTAKSNRFRFAKQQLCRCITFFIHFFAVTARVRREMPYFTICRGRELSFFLPELWYSPLELNSSIWRIKRDGISAIKFEAAQIHFLSDVFVPVAVVVASADHWWGLEMWVLILHSRLFFTIISVL